MATRKIAVGFWILAVTLLVQPALAQRGGGGGGGGGGCGGGASTTGATSVASTAATATSPNLPNAMAVQYAMRQMQEQQYMQQAMEMRQMMTQLQMENQMLRAQLMQAQEQHAKANSTVNANGDSNLLLTAAKQDPAAAKAVKAAQAKQRTVAARTRNAGGQFAAR